MIVPPQTLPDMYPAVIPLEEMVAVWDAIVEPINDSVCVAFIDDASNGAREFRGQDAHRW